MNLRSGRRRNPFGVGIGWLAAWRYSLLLRLASTVTLTRFLPVLPQQESLLVFYPSMFVVASTMLIHERYVGACQMSVTGLED